MLTRLKVSGFKNLVDVDVRFGAFTCIAGANGVGKSNLFDAIRFLSATAQMPLNQAALSIRNSSGKQSDIRNLFHRVGDHHVDKMSFEAEMIIPHEGINSLGQKVKAVNLYLRYSLDLGYKNTGLSGGLEIINEELISLNPNDKYLCKALREHIAIESEEIGNKFIYPEVMNNIKYIVLAHYTNNKRDKFTFGIATSGKSTVLSLCNQSTIAITENETQFLTRQEIISWQTLQLEPSPLRKANEFTAPQKLGMDGSNLAASFYHLVEKYYQQDIENDQEKQVTVEDIEAKVYAQASNRLAELIGDVDRVWVDRDDQRELLTLMLKDMQGTVYPARSLSDGTLRFLGPNSFRVKSRFI
ncbi:MAG: AAA family ATPase [Cyanobacteria bacterium J06621_8]